MYTVSIIVPVYNAERYVGKCIDSIINQTFSDIEVIIVNDGSTDNSIDICRKYEKEHDNVRLISTENKGVSCARNTGMESASGKYIMFLDADDYFDNDTIENMLQKIESDNSDLCICNYIKEDEDKKVYVNCFENNQLLNDKEVNNLIINLIENSNDNKEHLLAGARGPLGKLYRKQLIDKYDLKFNGELIIGEDFIFNLEYLIKCDKVSIINNNYYHYITNMDSATMKYKKMCWSSIYKKTILSLIAFLKDNNLYEEAKERVYKLTIKYFFMCIYNEMSENNTNNLEYKRLQIKHLCSDKLIKEAIHNFNVTYASPKEKLVIMLAKHDMYFLIYPLMKMKFHN